MSLKVPPIEEDFRYCKRVFLRWKGSEWSSSVFSVKVNFDGKEFIGPNRDSPYEGLTSLNKGLPWKFIDGIFFGIDEAKALELNVSPLIATYNYEGKDGRFSITYELLARKENFILSLTCNRPIEFFPFLDMRHIYGESKHDYQLLDKFIEGKLFVQIKGKESQIILGPLKEYYKINFRVSWYYKYGDGFRTLKEGRISFAGRSQEVFAPFIAKIENKFYISNYLEDNFYRFLGKLVEERREKVNRIVSKFKAKNYEEALLSRVIGLESFGLSFNSLEFPEAGAWWFKNIWFRDVLEGIRWNLLTYVEILDKKKWVEKVLNYLTKLCLKKGLLPNLLSPSTGELESFSSDATLILLNLWIELGEKFNISNEPLRELFEHLIKVFKNYPKMNEQGLILTKAFDSWVDSFKYIEGIGKFPSRVPELWARELGSYRAIEELYFLPEINSLWIKALKGMEELGIKHKFNLDSLLKNFLNTFWDDEINFLCNMVDSKGRKDKTITSMGLEALANLDFLEDELMGKAWKVVKEQLLTYRVPKLFSLEREPFCVKTKALKTIYFGDNEYHEGTLWPRNIPYLIKMALRMQERDLARKVLLNVLDHSLGEGALFYNSELFSLDDENLNPIPVKNPVQYWSHFLDPFLWINFKLNDRNL
ncbi:MAG: amylo-alpha-1,6-glucosidase [Nitrososphaerales archaeon]